MRTLPILFPLITSATDIAVFRFRVWHIVSESTKENLVNLRRFSRSKLEIEASILVKGGKLTRGENRSNFGGKPSWQMLEC